MAQAYIIKEHRVSDFKDPNGNTAVNLALEGYGEPVTIFVKKPEYMKDGDELYGNIKQVKSQSGKEYNRFFKEKREDFAGGGHASPKREYQPRDDKAIQAQWAINQGREAALLESDDPNYYAEVKDIAIHFFLMIDEVKAAEPKPLDSWDVKKEADKITPADSDDDKPVDMSDIPF